MPNDFVSLFLSCNASFETPESFWRWAAYSLVSATLRMNFYYNAGNETIYPNIYVLLLADSAAFRKGGPFPLVSDLSNELHHTKIYEGRASIQGILEKLSSDIGGKKGIPIKGGSCLILAEELAGFFVADPQLIPLITSMYRPRREFSYDLRGNSFLVKDLCLAMLAASNEINLRDVYDERAVYGGLLGRTFLVKPNERREANSLIKEEQEQKDFLDKYNQTKKLLLTKLNDIKQLQGQAFFTKEAVKLYNKWYKELYATLLKFPDPAGISGRIHTSVAKLALVIAASNLSMCVTEEYMQEAILQSINLRPNYDSYVMSSGRSDQATTGTLFLNAIWSETSKNGAIRLTRQKFLMYNWNQISATDLDQLTITLEQAGFITIHSDKSGVAYSLTQAAKDFIAGKQSAGAATP